MKLRSTIIALMIGLSLFGAACSKGGGSDAASSMSNDDKHKLYQAGVITSLDTAMEVAKKLGLTDSDGKPLPAFQQFNAEHSEWLTKNPTFLPPTPDQAADKKKAKEYVDAHMPK
jgi:hypothetical protein